MAKSPKQNSNGTTKRNLRSKGPPIAFKSAPSQNMSKQSSHNNIRTKRSPSSTKNHSHHEINSKSIESSGAISNSAIKSELKNGTKSSSDAINSVYNESNNSIMRKNNSIDKKSPPKKKKIIKTSSCKVTKNAETTMAKGDNATNKITSTNGHVSSPRGRGHRVASLNAMFKVHLMYESQRKRGSDEESDYQVASSTSSSPSRKPKSKPTVTPNKAALQQNSKATSAKDSSGKKSKKSTHVKKETSNKKEKIKKTVKKVETKKKAKKESEKDSSKGKELVLVDPKSKQIKVARKRKLANEDVEIIDTRLCKRMASLNASAILAASYLPEKIVKRSRSIESSRSIGSTVEMIQETKISSSISRVQVPSSTTIHSVHETNHVVVESAKTIETVKEVRRMSGKIRDRLVAIEMMERENDASKEPLDTISNNRSKSRITSAKQTNQTSVRRSTKTNRRTDHHLNHQHPVLNGPEATGVRTTEYQVTKVQMSTNKGTHMKREKLAHQIETILEKDAVVREYQFQSKATSQSYRIQMESSSYNQPVTNVLNSSTVHALPCLPIHTPSVSDLHLNSGPSVIQSAPILTTNQGLNHAACFTHPNQPVLQIACNSPYRALQPASISQLPVLNIGPQYPSHYASAFSVPHYSNPAASINYSTETYGFYPPGSIIQPIHDPYIRAYPLHKPIPFHASPMVHTRIDQTYPDYGASMSSMSTQTSTGSLHQQSQTPSNHQQQQPQLQPQHTTLLTPTLQQTLITSNNITRPTPTTTIQIEPLRPHFENTNSFILHQPISDLSYTFRPHEIISREEPVILPLDVPRSTSISSINMNHNMNNQSVPSNTNNESTSEATVINSNCERPPSVTFLGTSSGSSSRGSISRLFSGITNNTGLGRGMSPIPGPSPVAVATPVSVDSTGTHQRSPLTVITEVFPVKRNNIEPKKSGTETHVSITPLMCEPTSSRSSRDISTSNCSATPIGSQRNDRAPNTLNHNHHHNPNSSSSNSSLNRVNNDKHASSSSTSSTSKTISTTSDGCQPSRPSNSSAICAVIPQRAPRKEAFLPPNPNISKKTTNQVKLKRPPTVPVCNINSQKKATSVACIPVNVAPPMKKKSPNLSKTRIEIVQADSRVSPNSDPSMSKKSGKKRLSHGWSWEGKPSKELVYVKAEDPPQLRDCYPAICHIQGDIIRVRDCVLLRSGPRKTDLHFVAKIGALWEAPDTGEMMMSLLWYYRPEHTEPGRKPHQMPDEIFASKHRDVNSVACIDDKCYVLTFNEYCRYRRELKMKAEGQKTSLIDTIVPLGKETYFRKKRLPSGQVCPDRVFCCRKVYDFRLKRTLKNPI